MLLENLKGTHTGIVLERELKKRGLEFKEFAASLNESEENLQQL